MPRPKRADEAGAVYHALNRGNAKRKIFKKAKDYEAFERTLAEGLGRYDVDLFSYTLMPSHWHFVLRPNRDGQMGRFLRWISATHTQRFHAHYHSAGEGHLYQGPYKSFPVQDDAHFIALCRYVERNPLRASLVVRAEDWKHGSLYRWHNRLSEPSLLSPWPIARPPGWLKRVNVALSGKELEAIRQCVQRGRPFGEECWIEETADRLNLWSTLRPRGRPRVRPIKEGNQ